MRIFSPVLLTLTGVLDGHPFHKQTLQSCGKVGVMEIGSQLHWDRLPDRSGSCRMTWE